MKTAVVTGTSSGIGKVTAQRLIENGWKVYGLSRSKTLIENDNFIWLECDLAQSKTIAACLEEITEPVIDLLVSNAGIAFEEPASAASQQSYEKMFSVNVLAPILLVNTLKTKILNATIISISSVSDRLVDKDFALYCSSKAANTRYFEALAGELSGAKVITLLPDYVDTPMLRELQEGRDFDWEGTIKVEDIAKLIIEITSNDHNVTSGSNIIIITNSLIDDLESREKLFSFNADTGELSKL